MVGRAKIRLWPILTFIFEIFTRCPVMQFGAQRPANFARGIIQPKIIKNHEGLYNVIREISFFEPGAILRGVAVTQPASGRDMHFAANHYDFAELDV